MIRKNILSISVAIIILILSLTNAEELQKISKIQFRGMDKIIHFSMYFAFMSVVFFENRKRLIKTGNLLIAALIPFVFSALMEILQETLTRTRSGSIYDLLFNLAGILFALIIYIIIRALIKEPVR